MLLLDTCALLWLSDDSPRLSPTARQAIGAAAGQLFVSAISAFEIAPERAEGKLGLPLPPDAWFAAVLAARGIVDAPVDWRIALHSAQLPALHSDPCDRIIVATAQLRALRILTPDPLIQAYPGISTLW